MNDREEWRERVRDIRGSTDIPELFETKLFEIELFYV